MSNPWGYITTIDSRGCDSEAINSVETFQSFVDEVLEKIDMVKIGDLHSVWCETNEPIKRGWSWFQLLQTSNITCHFCPEDQNAGFLDLFSCKQYDDEIVFETFCKYFKPEAVSFRTFDRHIPQ